MDGLDAKILWELTQAQTILPARLGINPSFREIAKKLDVSPGTIRNRIKRMYSAGVIRGSSVYPNPNLLGLNTGAYAVDVSPRANKHETVLKLASIEGVLFVQNFRGNLVGIAFVYYDNGSLKEKIEKFEVIASSYEGDGARGMFSRVRYPPCSYSLSNVEAELILHISKEPFNSYGELARELGISVRTLERRLSRLIQERAILSVPTMDYRKIEGGVPADLIVLFSANDDRSLAHQRIMQLLGNYIIYAGAWEEFGMYSLIVTRVSEVSDLAERVNHIEGVKGVRGEIVEEHIDRVGVLGAFVERWMSDHGMLSGSKTD